MTVTFDSLVDRARDLASGRRAILGIAGAPAAGKTTLAENLVAALLAAGVPVAHVPMDGFHLADVELDRLGLRDRKGAPDTFDALGYAALLHRLRDSASSPSPSPSSSSDEIIYAPGFERTIEQPIAGAIPVRGTDRLIISEGNYLLVDDPRWNQVRAQFDEVWYVDLDQEERLRRLVSRHVRFGKPEADAVAWATGTDENNAKVIMATRTRADLIVPAEALTAVQA